MTAAESPVELADVGALACLYRRDTGALSILTPAARAAWLRRGHHGGDGDDQGMDAAWRAQGFLGGAAGDARGLKAQGHDAEPRPALLDRCYGLAGDRVCRLTVDAEPLAELLAAVLRPLEVVAGTPAGTEVAVTAEAGGAIVRAGGRSSIAGDISAARSETLRQVLLALVGSDRVGALLHASTVAGPRGAVALLGQSGSGKSTLAATLVADGLVYVADDLSALDPHAAAVHPFPLGLSVKSGSAAVICRRFPELAAQPELTTRRLRVRYLDLMSRAVPPDRTVPLAALVFPVYDPGLGALEATRLAPEAALHLAIESGSVPDGDARSIHPLARMCNEVPAWHLAYADAAGASAVVRRLAGCAR